MLSYMAETKQNGKAKFYFLHETHIWSMIILPFNWVVKTDDEEKYINK